MLTLANIEHVVKVVGVCVGLFGIYKYFDSLSQKKVDRTIQYASSYYSGEVLKSRKKVGALSFAWTNAENADGSALSIDQLLAMMAVDLEKPDTRIEVEVLLDFFDRMRVCILNDACNRDVASSLLEPEARHLAVLVTPLVASIRDVDADYGQGMTCLAAKQPDPACFD